MQPHKSRLLHAWPVEGSENEPAGPNEKRGGNVGGAGGSVDLKGAAMYSGISGSDKCHSTLQTFNISDIYFTVVTHQCWMVRSVIISLIAKR